MWLIERMTTGDLKEVLAIEKMSFPTPWTEKMFKAGLQEENIYSWVVRDKAKGKVKGYVVFSLVLDELHLLNLAVHLTARRKKVASFLLEKVFDFARNQGSQVVLLEVGEKNYPAQALYKKLGFIKINRRKDYYPTGEDALIMEKKF
jgi:ribosomal-protein-alanine N-acetyltransferase